MSDSSIPNVSSSQDLGSARSLEAVGTLRRAQSSGSDPNKIDKAARSFESLLVGHWLEQAEKSFASVPGSDPDEQSDSSREQFMSIACESLAQGLSSKGGLGIAQLIRRALDLASDHRVQSNLKPSPDTTEPISLPKPQ